MNTWNMDILGTYTLTYFAVYKGNRYRVDIDTRRKEELLDKLKELKAQSIGLINDLFKMEGNIVEGETGPSYLEKILESDYRLVADSFEEMANKIQDLVANRE